jgi:large subunit ribosomal protein L25
MDEIILKAQKRTVKGKQVKALRREGLLPAVIYGHNLTPFAISLDHHLTSRALAGVSASRLVVIDVEGERHTTLVRDRMREPIHSSLIHIDFQEVSLTETLRTQVTLEFVGEAPAVKVLNGVLVEGLTEVEIECLPGNLPDHLTVDLSSLTEIGAGIYVRDLVPPTNVAILTPGEEMIAVVTAPLTEEAAIAAEGGAVAEPEVVAERGKKEDEEF